MQWVSADFVRASGHRSRPYDELILIDNPLYLLTAPILAACWLLGHSASYSHRNVGYG